ncbi:MAG: dihydropteroate synthase [Hyphomicrobiales bacterium]|nr:dihydropteroate synthase [Hyphomicrobiales bacterium]
MGILNVTPDSFSDGGKFDTMSKAIDQAAQMIKEGADIIDVGGESTKPGAGPVDQDLEQQRVLPIVEELNRRFDTIISIDTYRPDTAKLAIEAGAHLVNDVGGFQYDGDMAGIVCKYRAGVCLMHNSRNRSIGDDIIADQIEYLGRCVSTATAAGVTRQQIIVDPGFGFGKDVEENLLLLDRFCLLHELALPILTGTSRKRFTGAVLGNDDSSDNRDKVTAATCVVARMAGSAVFRVHDVKSSRLALKLADSVLNTRNIS